MKIGIIGCGNMGSAIARGILSKKVLPFNNIYVSDKDALKTKALHRQFGIRLGTNEEIAKKCNFIIVAVKPQDSDRVLSSISKDLDSSKHLISIMAGVKISKIESLVDKKVAVTRAMPNLAATVGKSMTCLCHNKAVKVKGLVHNIFSAIGDILEIDEEYMDIATAVSGSGPAYFYYLAEAFRDAAVKLGMKKEDAEKLAVNALAGSGDLIEILEHTPEELRMRITSKNGITEAAMSVLKSEKFKDIIFKAVNSAVKRSKALSGRP